VLSLVSALLPAGTDPRVYTAEEQTNIEVIRKLRSASFSERKKYMHPAMVRHRWGFASLADITGMKDGAGYDSRTVSDRVDTIEDIIAKGDRVWAIWTCAARTPGAVHPRPNPMGPRPGYGGEARSSGLVLRRRTPACSASSAVPTSRSGGAWG
jgi:hypothetical protein